MRRSLLPSLLVLTLLAPGCATRRQAKIVAGTLGVTSGVAAVTGVGLVVGGQCSAADLDAHLCEADGLGPALGFFTLKVAAVLAGVAIAVYYTAPDGPAPASERTAPAAPIAATVPAPTVPAVPRTTDIATGRLAAQAIRAAAFGNCAAARITLSAVAERDAEYHVVLRGQPVFDRCL